MKNNLTFISVLLVAAVLSAPAHAIKKCKDSEGKWHYGDIAVRACENSKVTTLNDRGFIKSEQAAPKTEAELRLEAETLALEKAEQDRIKAEQDERSRILSIYETESDIDRQRDNQLDSVQSNIDVHTAYLKGMDSRTARFEKKKAETTSNYVKKDMDKKLAEAKVRIKSSQKELAALKQQKDDIVAKFEKEKALYRELTEEANAN